MKYFWLLVFISVFICKSQAQNNEAVKENTQAANDSIKKAESLNYIGNGYFPTKYINLDFKVSH